MNGVGVRFDNWSDIAAEARRILTTKTAQHRTASECWLAEKLWA